MSLPQSQRPPVPSPAGRDSIPTASIIALVGKGLSVREILALFPELKSEDVRSALLRAAELMQDDNASLVVGDPVGEIIRQAQLSSGLSEDEATEVAVAETRAVRQERVARRK